MNPVPRCRQLMRLAAALTVVLAAPERPFPAYGQLALTSKRFLPITFSPVRSNWFQIT